MLLLDEYNVEIDDIDRTMMVVIRALRLIVLGRTLREAGQGLIRSRWLVPTPGTKRAQPEDVGIPARPVSSAGSARHFPDGGFRLP